MRQAVSSVTPVIRSVAAVLGYGVVAICCANGAAAPLQVGPPWPNEPAGWMVVTDYDMHAFNDGGWSNVNQSDITDGSISVVSDPTGPLNPTTWQLLYPQGSDVCGSSPATEYYDFASPLKRLYVGFWVKFSNPFSFPTGSGGDDEVHVVTIFTAQGNGSGVVLDMQGDGDLKVVNEMYPPGGTYNVATAVSPNWALGVWNKVEMLFDYTGGVMKAWVNGKAVISTSGEYYPSDAGFTEYHVEGVWGGCTSGVPSSDGWIRFDHVHISAQ